MTDAPEGFDLDAWISGARAPERTCTVYGRGDLVAEAELLAAQIADADSRRDPDRMNSGADPAWKDRLAGLRREFEASALTFRFRAPTRDEIKATTASIPDGASDDAATFAMLSLQVVSPSVVPSQWGKIRDRVGTGQFQQLLDAANGAFGDGRLSVPFSLATSAAARMSSRS